MVGSLFKTWEQTLEVRIDRITAKESIGNA